MAFKALPYDSQDTAIWHSSHCHMALKSLPYGSQAIAIWHSSHCHMALKSLPCGTQVTAIWHSSHCHMSVKTLPPSCGTNLSQPLLSIWSPYLIKDIAKIESIQKQFTRYICIQCKVSFLHTMTIYMSLISSL